MDFTVSIPLLFTCLCTYGRLAMTLLSIAQALAIRGTPHTSPYEIAVQGGISKAPAKRISRVVRGICVRMAQAKKND